MLSRPFLQDHFLYLLIVQARKLFFALYILSTCPRDQMLNCWDVNLLTSAVQQHRHSPAVVSHQWTVKIVFTGGRSAPCLYQYACMLVPLSPTKRVQVSIQGALNWITRQDSSKKKRFCHFIFVLLLFQLIFVWQVRDNIHTLDKTACIEGLQGPSYFPVID